MRDAAWQSRAKNLGSVPDGGLRGRDSTPLGLCGLHSPGRGKETHHRRSLWAFSGIIVPGQSGHSTWHGGARCHTPRMGPPNPSTHQSLLMPLQIVGKTAFSPGLDCKLQKAAQAFCCSSMLLDMCRYSANRSVTRRTLTPQTYAQTREAHCAAPHLPFCISEAKN